MQIFVKIDRNFGCARGVSFVWAVKFLEASFHRSEVFHAIFPGMLEFGLQAACAALRGSLGSGAGASLGQADC
jgi:hypothetical protein